MGCMGIAPRCCGAAIFVMLLSATGCTSVVSSDPAKTTALNDLSYWHLQAVDFSKNGPTAKQQDYKNAQMAVNSWIQTEKAAADQAAPNIFGGPLDLSRENQPPSGVRQQAINLFGQPPRSLAGDLYDWISGVAKQMRTQSATNLKSELDSFAWPDWDTTGHHP